MSDTESDVLTCPTCGARQQPSAECRRCRCDLSLVWAAHRRCRSLHLETLRHLREGRPERALQTARQRWSLSPDADASRLLAVCSLLRGDFRTALDMHETMKSADGRHG